MMKLSEHRVFLLIIGITLIPFLASLTVAYEIKKKTTATYTRVIKVEGGWGYEIMHKKKPFIHQEYIPAIPGNHVFCDRKEARKVGKLAQHRFKETGRPTIFRTDLDSLGISYPVGAYYQE